MTAEPEAPADAGEAPDAGRPASRGSAFQRLLGYRLEVWESGRAVVVCPLRPDHLNVGGVPHGGLLATLIDAACSFAGLEPAPPEARRERIATISLTVNYLAAAETGPLVAEARRTGGGRSVCFAAAEVRDGSGRTVATGSGAFRLKAVRPEGA